MKRLGLAFSLSLLSLAACAADLEVTNGWIRLLPAGVPAAGYFEVRNNGKAAARLVGASSPAFGHTMLHRTVEEKGRSTMQHVHEVAIPAGGKLAFAPGGYHLMFTKPSGALKIGDKVPVTLQFDNGEKVTAELQVRGPSGQ